MGRRAGSTGEKTAKAIALAAVRLFAGRGYAAVSMRAIAEEVGIQVGALYNYFPTKQAILATVMISHMSELLEAFENAVDAAQNPLRQLEAFARFHVRYHMNRRDGVFIAFMELRSLDEENFKEAEALRQGYEYRLRDILEEGRKQGFFLIDDAHVSAMALIAMLTGVTTWFKPDGRLSACEIEEIYVGLTLRAAGVSVAERARARKAC